MVKILLSINELKEAVFSLKTNKSLRCDDISFTVVKKCFGEINELLKHIFNILIENEKMEIAKITPLFKNSDPEKTTNYHPISFLPFLSKLLENIIYNRLYKYLCEQKLLFSKQFGFQKGYSTDHQITWSIHRFIQGI